MGQAHNVAPAPFCVSEFRGSGGANIHAGSLFEDNAKGASGSQLDSCIEGRTEVDKRDIYRLLVSIEAPGVTVGDDEKCFGIDHGAGLLRLLAIETVGGERHRNR